MKVGKYRIIVDALPSKTKSNLNIIQDSIFFSTYLSTFFSHALEIFCDGDGLIHVRRCFFLKPELQNNKPNLETYD
jgi:hypothetical protein